MSNIKNDRKEQVMIARNNFFNYDIIDTNAVAPEIYESWKRSLDYNLNPSKQNMVCLSKADLEKRKMDNHDLLEIAIPYMNILYDIVKGSKFVIMLADQDGYILKVVGDEIILKCIQSKKNPVIEGVCRHESVFGTGGIGTPIAIRKPIQLTSSEMFYTSENEFTGTGAPLINEDGDVIGAICMSGQGNDVHPHTLGMVTAASHAIARQLSLKQMYNKLLVTQNQMHTILSTVNRGVFLLGKNFEIIDTNHAATKILGFNRNEILKKDIADFITNFDLKDAKDADEIELIINGKFKAINCFVTIRLVNPIDTNNSSSLLITFNKASNVQKLVNRYIGLNAAFHFEDIIGEAHSLIKVKKFAEIVAGNWANVLLLGESGTGKELFAQAIHNESQFADGPFVAVNCGAIPKTLIESELFGYEAGAFTGAKREGSAGKFELANHGTIFLDEIGEMPYEAQVHLLRILEAREVTRIGGNKSIPLDIRIIAATNINLEKAVQENTFRSDLYYRLKVIAINIPPLRDRGEDILLLTDYFINKYGNINKKNIKGVMPSVADLFMKYTWPGNIRELENTVERSCLLTQDEYIKMDVIPPSITRIEKVNPNNCDIVESIPIDNSDTDIIDDNDKDNYLSSINDAEKKVIVQYLKRFNGNIKKTAEVLEMNRRTLYRKINKHSINIQSLRQTQQL